MDVAPNLDVLEFVGLREYELFRKLNFACLIVGTEETLGHDSSSVENARKCSSEQVALLSAKGRVSVDIGVQVASEDVLDKTRLLDMIRAAVRKLDPVLEQVRCHPEHSLIDTFAARLHGRILRVLLGLGQAADSNPVVGLRAENLTTEAESVSSRHHCQALDRLLKTKRVVLTEADTGPLEHLSLFSEVRDAERLVLGE